MYDLLAEFNMMRTTALAAVVRAFGVKWGREDERSVLLPQVLSEILGEGPRGPAPGDTRTLSA